jgi:hypothetical protein
MSWRQANTVSPTGNDTFQGVSARASNDVWAVGFYLDGGGNKRMLTEHYAG